MAAPARRPTLDDVKAVIGGDDIVLDIVRRSSHDHFDAVISADVLLGICEQVYEHIEEQCEA